jgi:hypothetical protein
MLCSFSDSIFFINEEPYNFSSIRCDIPPASTIKEVGKCNLANVVKGSIGFNLRNEFLEVIEVCFDTVNNITVQTRHTLNRNIVRDESEDDRKNYILLELFETPDQFYTCKNQVANLGHLLGPQTHVHRYINCDKGGDMYLTKAHLVPKSDFLFEFQQKTTSYNINTAPQWQTINTGNWRILENRIRRYANNHSADLTIVTGTLNVKTLPHLLGVQQHKGLQNNATMALPALFWKLVHDRTRNAGIVFLIINDPYVDYRHIFSYTVCNCVCSKTTSWFHGWNRFNMKKGYVYCCTVDNFRANTGMTLYPFRVRNLLL